MRQIILAFVLVHFVSSVVAQTGMDTLSSYPMGFGFTQLTVVNNGDTSIQYNYPNGQLESSRSLSQEVYKRYDPKGNLMWEQEIIDGKGNGKMKFFAPNGKHLGTLELKNDSIIDTVFINSTTTFVYGRITYSSVMHGGMRRPDGSSNISRSEGGKRFTPMYVVKHENSKQPDKYKEFTTDVNGYFFFIAEQGSFGVFPNHFNVSQVRNDMGTPIGRNSGAVHKQWNISAPIELQEKFCYLSLHVHSIGYAP